MEGKRKVESRSSAETKSRIVSVAQQLFASKGYSHAGLREIAATAGVAPSLVIKYFGTKAALFEQALIDSIMPPELFQADPAKFGETIVTTVLERGREMHAPAMIALALGEAEAREVTARVVKERIIDPMAKWLDFGHDGRTELAKSINVYLMTTGFCLFALNMDLKFPAKTTKEASDMFARILQHLVDLDPGQGPDQSVPG